MDSPKLGYIFSCSDQTCVVDHLAGLSSQCHMEYTLRPKLEYICQEHTLFLCKFTINLSCGESFPCIMLRLIWLCNYFFNYIIFRIRWHKRHCFVYGPITLGFDCVSYCYFVLIPYYFLASQILFSWQYRNNKLIPLKLVIRMLYVFFYSTKLSN